MSWFSRWMNEREERRRKRHRMEEVMGWILVPIIVVLGIWAGQHVYSMAKEPLAAFTMKGER